MCTSSVSDLIYLKFSHGVAFHTLNGKNFNVMLESDIKICLNSDPSLELSELCSKKHKKNSLGEMIMRTGQNVFYGE